MLTIPKRFRSLALAVAAFFCVQFLALPTFAFTSLNSCLTNPSCAAMLTQAGITGASAVPAAAPTAAATGAAASTIVLPNIGNALGVGAGIAALAYAWSPQQADRLAQLYEAPQSEDLPPPGTGWTQFHYFDAGLIISPLNNTNPDTVYTLGDRCLSDQGVIRLRDGVSEGCMNNRAYGRLNTTRFIYIGDNPQDDFTPAVAPGASPTPEQFRDLLGDPIEIPWPDPQAGPDGQLGTDDDVYPPLTIPGPYIGVEDGTATYTPADFNADNELAPAPPEPEAEPLDRSLFEGSYQEPPPIGTVNVSAPHFLVHAMDVFSDKFPLDVLGTLPDAEASSCPVFEFYGESFEMCIINTFMDAMKVPVLVSFVIWSLLAL